MVASPRPTGEDGQLEGLTTFVLQQGKGKGLW
jgi:hypothetical protein